MKAALRLATWMALLPAFSLTAAQSSERVLLFPRLAGGQSFTYEISYRAETTTSADSNVAAPMAPPSSQTNTRLVLKVDVLAISSEFGKPLAHLRTRFVNPGTISASAQAARHDSTISSPPPANLVEFSLHADGRVTDLTGFDVLSGDERAAWQEWVGRFGIGAALPEKGPKRGDKWKADEQITNALLTGLSWDKEVQYVDDEPCRGPARGQPPEVASASQSDETCAVILTTATLKQKSPQKDSTPDDFKLHDLRTYGVAKGKNEVITYISRSSGLVVRATEDANQSINVIVAKADGSNRVHYMIDAQSHTRVLLLPPTP